MEKISCLLNLFLFILAVPASKKWKVQISIVHAGISRCLIGRARECQIMEFGNDFQNRISPKLQVWFLPSRSQSPYFNNKMQLNKKTFDFVTGIRILMG